MLLTVVVPPPPCRLVYVLFFVYHQLPYFLTFLHEREKTLYANLKLAVPLLGPVAQLGRAIGS